MNHLDLYSGIGAMALAAHTAGMRTVAFCEADPFCRSVLRKNFPSTPILCHDTQVTPASVKAGIDIISGGFPCQPFSLAGRRRGADDRRNRWPEMLRIITDFRPTWVVGENVRGLVSSGYLVETG